MNLEGDFTSETEFEDKPVGTLVALESEERTGIEYDIWFPYARVFMNQVREGALVAVRNFSSRSENPRYSILELVQVLPVHYALGSSARDAERAFPGFVIEGAKSARQDWEQEVPTEESTQIRTTAIPTGVQLSFESERYLMEVDESLPMQGEDVYVLRTPLVSQIMNRGLLGIRDRTISVGHLVQTSEVEILVKIDDLLRTHFGVFGFTGAGKSNLMSTIIARLLSSASPPRIVLFDLMGEYLPLLADVIHSQRGAHIVSLNRDSLPGGNAVRDYLWRTGGIDEAAAAVARTQLLPRDLYAHRGRFAECMKSILEDGKFRIWDPGAQLPVGLDLITQLRELIPGNAGKPVGPMKRWIDASLSPHMNNPVPGAVVQQMSRDVDNFIAQDSVPDMRPQAGPVQAQLGGQAQQPAGAPVPLTPSGRDALFEIRDALRILIPAPEARPPQGVAVTRSDLLGILNGREPALVVVEADNDDLLRNFSSQLVHLIFNHRRQEGRSEPSVLFVYDEADEFIPRETPNDSYGASRRAAAVLARRGRKFGMGLAIATQRVAYLDTNILAQPHSYFVSKLPREYDRTTMAEAFGITDEMMQRTLRFRIGDWLLVSFDATGLVNVPMPVHVPNANDRILGHLSEHE
jgi:hypothetical protein